MIYLCYRFLFGLIQVSDGINTTMKLSVKKNLQILHRSALGTWTKSRKANSMKFHWLRIALSVMELSLKKTQKLAMRFKLQSGLISKSGGTKIGLKIQ